jgi:hypothetical protein
VEEAEAAPETLVSALQLIALFARGCRSPDDWTALCLGPYGDELFHQAWLLYVSRIWLSGEWFRNTCAQFAGLRRPMSYWESGDGQTELERMLHSEKPEEVGRALLTYCAILWLPDRGKAVPINTQLVEQNIFREERYLHEPAMWAWALARRHRGLPRASPSLLDRLMSRWLTDSKIEGDGISAFALSGEMGLPRNYWKPILTDEQREQVRLASEGRNDSPARVVIAFHNRSIWSEEELARRLVGTSNDLLHSSIEQGVISDMLLQIDADKDFLKSLTDK